MATTTAARSPSPGPARSSSPCCAAMRRSADSIPFKPTDCPQRKSKNGGGCGCHASPRAFFGEKENDQRDAARTTPKARGSGGAKNFMAPTFSAASKAIAASASPRKKVLGERNEHQHLAPSSPADLAHNKPKGLPEGDLVHNKPKGPPEAGAGTRRLRLSFDGAAPAPPTAALEISHGSRHSFGGEDARLENPMFKENQYAAVDPVDAEPSRAAPYDPKTNYLSPRPRFLRYKPNTRIEMYRHGGSGVRRLEDGFASESSEETDITTVEDDESSEEEKEQQAQQKPEPNDSPEEPSAQAAPSEAQVLPPALVLTSEPAATSPRARVQTPEPRETSPRARAQTPEPREISPRARAQTPEPELGASSARAPATKRSSRRFLLAAPLALLLFVAAAFFYVPPPPDSPLMSKVSDYLSVQELHPVELAAWLKQWSSSSLDSITSYWEALASTKEQEFFGSPFAANLSAANVDADHDVDFYYNFAETWRVPSEEPIYAGVLEELIQDVVSESNTDLTAEPVAGDVVVEEQSIDVVVEEQSIDAVADDYKEVDELDVEMSEEDPSNNGEEMSSSSQNLDSPSQPTTEAEQTEMEEQEVETDESEGDHPNGKEDQEAYRALKSDSGMWTGYMDKISKPAAVGVALLAIILATGMTILYTRKKQAQVSANADTPAAQAEEVMTQPEQAEEVMTQSVSGSSEGHLVKSSQFQSSMAEETEKFGDSDFSQYSSSLSSSHGRRRKAKEEEGPSLEPTSKRESMTYSTSSYGSFTTYEKISAKKKNKEDDAMTPVRRSSRLRSVKSPES